MSGKPYGAGEAVAALVAIAQSVEDARPPMLEGSALREPGKVPPEDSR